MFCEWFNKQHGACLSFEGRINSDRFMLTNSRDIIGAWNLSGGRLFG
jgi:hypothetical protein